MAMLRTRLTVFVEKHKEENCQQRILLPETKPFVTFSSWYNSRKITNFST